MTEPRSAAQELLAGLTQTVSRLAEQVGILQTRLDAMGDEIVTKRLVATHLQVDYGLEVGVGLHPRVAITSEPGEGWAGITGWSGGDDVGFELDAYEPHHECHLRTQRGDLRIYGSGTQRKLSAS